MTDFWKTQPEAAGPLTEEQFFKAMEAMMKPLPPAPVIYPPFLAKETRK